MHVTGAQAVFILIPLLVGLAVCGAGGLYLGCCILDWGIERYLRSRDIYREFLAFAKPRVIARLKKEQASDKASS